MNQENKFYITTPIYYINDKPHVGHAYTTIAADALARYYRNQGRDVFFLTGTDENSQKNIAAARRHYEKNDLSKDEVQKYLDKMSAIWQKTWKALELTNDDFIRTTEKRHMKAVRAFFKRVWDNGDIYKGLYEGYYCNDCEAFIKESDLEDGKCPIHKKSPSKIKEENYFFKLTKYRKQLLDYIKNNPKFIQPESRKKEIINYIKDFAEDVSITREGLKWGIEVPEIKNQALYVWFDALVNYLSAIGFGDDEKKFNKFWPADLHLVGKDIIKFHCALWPAMLLSAGLDLPKKVFAHGYFTIDGEKMSKTIGNVINPVNIAEKYGNDTLRYYLLREISFGEDGDFSIKRLEERYNSDLANGLGNLISRVFSIAEKNSISPKSAKGEKLKDFWRKYENSIEELKLHNTIALIWEEISKCDIIIDKEKPWELAKSDPKKLKNILAELFFRIKEITQALKPFLPKTAKRIENLFDSKDSIKDNPLFPRLEK